MVGRGENPDYRMMTLGHSVKLFYASVYATVNTSSLTVFDKVCTHGVAGGNTPYDTTENSHTEIKKVDGLKYSH
jgi:hypothetical protein